MADSTTEKSNGERMYAMSTGSDDTAQQAVLENLSRIVEAARESDQTGAARSFVSTDLNLNVVRLGQGERIEGHVNSEVDVVAVVLAGAGTLELRERTQALEAGTLFLVPKGTWRAIHASDESDFIYLTCHRRRAGLFPTRPPRR
jgi:quercetin dioxygenase-like cupin family protein